VIQYVVIVRKRNNTKPKECDGEEERKMKEKRHFYSCVKNFLTIKRNKRFLVFERVKLLFEEDGIVS